MNPNNKMKTRSQNTCHIVRRVGKQGTRPPRESNQPGVEKCTTGFFYKQPSCQWSDVKNFLKIKQLDKQPPTLKALLQTTLVEL